jgi:hypothetical protein
MKNKVILWVLGVLLLIVFILFAIIVRYNYRQAHKNKFTFSDTAVSVNVTGVGYLDTIALVVLNKIIGYDSISIAIVAMPKVESADGEYSLSAYVEKDPQVPHRYWIHVFPAAARKDPFAVICHECVHIIQYESGRLYPSTIGDGMVFDGYTYLYSKVPYPQRPYEIAAFQLQDIYANEARHLIYDHK